MFRPSILRSFITAVGITLLSVGCTPENLAGPQAPLTTPGAALSSATTATTVTATASPAPNANLLGSVLGTVLKVPSTLMKSLFPVVQRKQSLNHSITVTRMIGSAGGSLSIAEAGFRITFAPGAVRHNTRITVTADSGRAVSYTFGPHGTQFYAPVTVQQDMGMTTLADHPEAAPGIRGGYVANGLGDIIGGLLARVTEILDATTNIVTGRDGKSHLGTTSFVVKHFSGYILISI